MCDGDAVHPELVLPVERVGRGHRLLEDLLVALLAQHGADVHQARLAAAERQRAALQHGEEEHAVQPHWGRRAAGAFELDAICNANTEISTSCEPKLILVDAKPATLTATLMLTLA